MRTVRNKPISMAAPAPSSAPCADSVIGSLCREIDRIRGRATQLLSSLALCQDRTLGRRLQREWGELQERRLAILSTARAWRRRGSADPLAVDFLIEVCRRPLALQRAS